MISQGAFIGVSTLLFTAGGTLVWCTSVSAMGEMPMPGGWMMSMTRMDADVRRGVACCRCVVPRQVGDDDGRNDAAILGADAVALPPGRSARQARHASVGSRRWSALGTSSCGPCWDGRFSSRRRVDSDRRCSSRRWRAVPITVGVVAAHCRRTPAPPGDTACASVSTAPMAVPPDGDPPRHRDHGPARDGYRDGSHHGRTSRSGR